MSNTSLENLWGDDFDLPVEKEKVKAVKVNGVEPTVENVKNGSYTVSRPFNIATKADVSDAAKDFLKEVFAAMNMEVVVEVTYNEEENTMDID